MNYPKQSQKSSSNKRTNRQKPHKTALKSDSQMSGSNRPRRSAAFAMHASMTAEESTPEFRLFRFTLMDPPHPLPREGFIRIDLATGTYSMLDPMGNTRDSQAGLIASMHPIFRTLVDQYISNENSYTHVPPSFNFFITYSPSNSNRFPNGAPRPSALRSSSGFAIPADINALDGDPTVYSFANYSRRNRAPPSPGIQSNATGARQFPGEPSRSSTLRAPRLPNATLNTAPATNLMELMNTLNDQLHHKSKKASDDAIRDLKKIDPKDLKESERACAICYEPYDNLVSEEDDLSLKDFETIKQLRLEPNNDDPSVWFPVDATGRHHSEYKKLFKDPSKEPKHQAVRMPCQHVFGNSCLVEWLKNHTSCPFCRKEVEAAATSVLKSKSYLPGDWSTDLETTHYDPSIPFPVPSTNARRRAVMSNMGGLPVVADLGSGQILNDFMRSFFPPGVNN